MSHKKKFKEIRQKMQEVTKRKPTGQQLDNLKKTFVDIDRKRKEKTKNE